MFKVFVITLGCPKNRSDTERMLGIYQDKIKITQNLNEADLIFINTCSFIRPAVEEAISTILEVASEIEKLSKRPVLIVTGCLVERYKKETLKKELPEVDFWLSIKEQNKWLELVTKKNNYPKKEEIFITTPKSYAYLKIAEGCNHKCTFCLIPSIRGKFQSRNIEEIKKELKTILSRGTKEVIIVAQDVTFFGKDKGFRDGLKMLLSELVTELVNFEIKWLRLLYLNPDGINKDLLLFLKTISPPFLPYFDIPLQHSHPEILKKMGRSPKSIYKVEEIREIFPNSCIRTTFIVGFPGEEKSHFENLLKFVETQKFNHVGVFSYYPEEGTKAYYKFNDNISKEEKKRRREEILKIQKEISKEHLKQYKNKIIDVLIDHYSEEWPTLYLGRTWFQAPEIDGTTYVSTLQKEPIGNFIKTLITETYEYDLSGLDVVLHNESVLK